MRTGVLVCLLMFAPACGKKLQPGKTPEETIRNVEAALRKLELGAVYDMMSSRCQGELDAALSGVQQVLCSVPDAQLKQAGLAGVAEMSPRDLIETAVDRAKDEAPDVLTRLKSFQIAILEVKDYGERATVKVMTMMDGSQTRGEIPLVREDGRWRLDSQDSLTNLPLTITPCVPSPSGFS